MPNRSPTIFALIVFCAAAVAIVAPNVISARSSKATNACMNNLRKIDGAKVQWKLEKLKSPGDMPSWADIQPFMPANWTNLKTCPDGGTYVLGRIGESPKCTFHRKYTVQ